jgi:hypothetical protein
MLWHERQWAYSVSQKSRNPKFKDEYEVWSKISGTKFFMEKLIIVSKWQPCRILGNISWRHIPEERVAAWLSREWVDLQCNRVCPSVVLWNGCVIGQFQSAMPSGITGLLPLQQSGGLTQILHIRCSVLNCLCNKHHDVFNCTAWVNYWTLFSNAVVWSSWTGMSGALSWRYCTK